MSEKAFSAHVLKMDCAAEADRICRHIRDALRTDLKRQGLVVGVSGGIDSTTVAALCTAAVGKDRVFALHMPERDSSPETLRLSRSVTDHLGIDSAVEVITPILQAVRCYERQADAVREVLPEYGDGWTFKIVLPSVIADDSFRVFSIVARTPDGKEIKTRLNPKAYLGIVAATNFKQRIRKMLEYHYADRFNYAVAGTPNRLEYDQGFFVKLGDGAADIKPIAHLYKSQVYAMAAHLGVPGEILKRPPTTDTYSMPQSQEEFYFSLPYDKMDLCLYGKNNGLTPEKVAPAVGLTAQQVQRVYNDIDQKRKTTRYLHLRPLLAEELSEISA